MKVKLNWAKDCNASVNTQLDNNVPLKKNRKVLLSIAIAYKSPWDVGVRRGSCAFPCWRFYSAHATQPTRTTNKRHHAAAEQPDESSTLQLIESILYELPRCSPSNFFSFSSSSYPPPQPLYSRTDNIGATRSLLIKQTSECVWGLPLCTSSSLPSGESSFLRHNPDNKKKRKTKGWRFMCHFMGLWNSDRCKQFSLSFCKCKKTSQFVSIKIIKFQD